MESLAGRCLIFDVIPLTIPETSIVHFEQPSKFSHLQQFVDKGKISTVEITLTRVISGSDARHLKGLENYLNKPVIRSFVLSNDPRVMELSKGILPIPA